MSADRRRSTARSGLSTGCAGKARLISRPSSGRRRCGKSMAVPLRLRRTSSTFCFRIVLLSHFETLALSRQLSSWRQFSLADRQCEAHYLPPPLGRRSDKSPWTCGLEVGAPPDLASIQPAYSGSTHNLGLPNPKHGPPSGVSAGPIAPSNRTFVVRWLIDRQLARSRRGCVWGLFASLLPP